MKTVGWKPWIERSRPCASGAEKPSNNRLVGSRDAVRRFEEAACVEGFDGPRRDVSDQRSGDLDALDVPALVHAAALSGWRLTIDLTRQFGHASTLDIDLEDDNVVVRMRTEGCTVYEHWSRTASLLAAELSQEGRYRVAVRIEFTGQWPPEWSEGAAVPCEAPAER